MTLRQQIFTKVLAQLALIRTTNSYTLYGQTFAYSTNIGANVFPWRSSELAETELPGMIVRDLDELRELSDKYGGGEKRSVHIQCAIAAGGATSADTMRTIFGDIDAAFGVGRLSDWDGLTLETRPRLTRMIADQESLRITGGIYEVYIDYATPAFQGRIS